MELVTAFTVAQAGFDRQVHAIRPEHWSSATPCTEWTVRDLLNHLVSEHLWAPWLLNGATLADVGDRFDGDQLGADPVGSWESAAAGSREAFTRPGALDRNVHTGRGPMPGTSYGWEMVTDLAVHSWDLGRAIGGDVQIDQDLVTTIYDWVLPYIGQWEGMGFFAPPVEVPAGADVQAKLIALLGRTP
jgi:uncharacterized protein (TIGR03086 family)